VTLNCSDDFKDNASRWTIRGLKLAGLSKSDDEQVHYVREQTVKLVDLVRKIDKGEAKARCWIRGSPGVGKSTTLFAALNSPTLNKSFLWVHADTIGYSVILKKKDGSCSHGRFRMADSMRVDEIIENADTLDVDYIVLDGADGTNMKTWFARSCSISDESNGKIKTIACTSYQALDYNSETRVKIGGFSRYIVDAWRYEEYLQGFEEGALKKLAKDQEELEEKFFYAGGSMRFMQQEIIETKDTIDDKIDTVNDFMMLLRSQQGKSSTSATNTLTQTFGDNTVPLSEYVMKILSRKVDMGFVEQAAAIMRKNPSWQGWVFELRMMVLIRRGSFTFTAMDGTKRSWTPQDRQTVRFNTNDNTTSLAVIPDNCCLEPEKYNQGCFDLIFFWNKERIDFFQFTIAQKGHQYKLKYIAAVLPALLQNNNASSTVEINFFVVVPKKNLPTFKIMASEVKNSTMIGPFDPRWSEQILYGNSSSPLQLIYYDDEQEGV